jgi:hypothetical protein
MKRKWLSNSLYNSLVGMRKRFSKSDFEVIGGDEEDIYIEKCEDTLWAAKETISKRFQPWGGASSSKKGEDNLFKSTSKDWL